MEGVLGQPSGLQGEHTDDLNERDQLRADVQLFLQEVADHTQFGKQHTNARAMKASEQCIVHFV